MERTATAQWKGVLKTGKGTLTTQSGALKDTPYSFPTRFEDEIGTNPEELIGAAHAGCFTMALSSDLEKKGFTAEQLTTSATVRLEKVNGANTISHIHLKLVGKVPGISATEFEELARVTKETCIVSRVLNAEISLETTLA